jgi:hypothetical protein
MVPIGKIVPAGWRCECGVILDRFWGYLLSIWHNTSKIDRSRSFRNICAVILNSRDPVRAIGWNCGKGNRRQHERRNGIRWYYAPISGRRIFTYQTQTTLIL